MQEITDLIASIASDPTHLIFFLGPIGFILFVLIAIGIIRTARRKLEERVLQETAQKTLADIQADTLEATQEEVQERIPEIPQDVEAIKKLDRSAWLRRLNDGLKKTRDSFTSNLSGLFSQRTKINADVKERVHEVLYRSDLGVATATKLVGLLEKDADSQDISWDDVKTILKKRIVEILSTNDEPLNTPPEPPLVVLLVGVNGVGKTTTAAKLSASYLAQDKSVLLCAADTFRAAAIDQLRVWGDRLGVDVIAHQQGADPAAVAYDGVKAAIARGIDTLIVDTAGRLHSKKELMDELHKINRVLGKDKPGAPHETWLVVDATTGQNALLQIKAFKDVVALTGLVVTKLDGTAKGGVIIAAADLYKVPIRYIGVGEKAEDLRPFHPTDFAESLLG